MARETVTTGDYQAAVGDQDLFGCHIHALGRSTTLAATAFTAVGSTIDLFRSFHGQSVFTCNRADTAHAELTRGFQTQPVTLDLFSRPVKAVDRRMAAVACDSFEEPQVRAR